MESYLYVVIFFMVATMLVILFGIGMLAINAKWGKKYATKLMSLRIILQALVIVLVAIVMLFGKKLVN